MDTQLRLWTTMNLDRVKNKKQKKNRPSTRKDEPPFIELRVATSVHSSVSATQRRSCFYLLPYEIRRQVLIYAFGGRQLHLDLSFKYPYAKSAQKRDRGSLRSCGIKSKAPKSTLEKLKMGLRRRKQWQWWGCECRRSSSDAQWMWSNDTGPSALGPWVDECCDGCRRYCTNEPSEQSENYQIGIMGWLLSCRQAYDEGTEILYSMNDFKISSEFLISNIQKLLLPSPLAMIPALEISWPLELSSPQGDSSPRKLQGGHLEKLLTVLQRYFPSLKRLYISFYSTERYWIHRWVSGYEILSQIDQLVANCPGLRECAIALPDSIHESLQFCVTGKKLEERAWENIKIWRDVNGRMVSADPIMNSRYPEPPEQRLDPTTQKPMKGYWVFEGDSDGMALIRSTIQQCCLQSGFDNNL